MHPERLDVERNILELGSADAGEREAAAARLRVAGVRALGPLRDAARDTDDPEIRFRAAALADEIEKDRWEVRRLEGHKDIVWAVTFTPDGRLAVTAGGARFVPPPVPAPGDDAFVNVGWDPGSDFAIRVWDLATGKELLRLEGHTAIVSGLALTRDGRTLASGAHDNTIRLWDLPTGKLLRQFRGHTGPVEAVALSPDGGTLVSSSRDGTVRVWNVTAGREVGCYGPKVPGRRGPWVRTVAMSPDRKTVAAGSDDGAIRVWDLKTGQETMRLLGHNRTVMAVAFAPEGGRLLSGGWDGRVRIWDLQTGKQLRSLDGHRSYVECVAWSSDGRLLLTGSLDKTVRLWDPETGKQVHLYDGHAAPIADVAFSPDGRHALSGGWDHTVRLWLTPERPQQGPDAGGAAGR